MPKKLDIAGKERKRKEREQERKIEIDSPPPPSPQKETNFGLCACTQTKMKHNYVQFAKNVENLFSAISILVGENGFNKERLFDKCGFFATKIPYSKN